MGTKMCPKDGGVLLVANHQSFLDPVLVAVHLSRPVSFLAKSELFENPYFGWFIRMLHAFPVRQGEGDIGAVKEIIRRLGEGHAVNIYPEGSRTETGEMARLEKGRGAGDPQGGGAGCAGGDRRVVRGLAEGKDAFSCPSDPGEIWQADDFDGKRGEEIVRELEEELRRLLGELRAIR